MTGNLYDKYGSRNPVVRLLMSRFSGALDELLAQAAPATLLDVGCGEGVLPERWAQRVGRIVAVDVEDPGLRAQWARRAAPNLEFGVADAGDLPFSDDAFDVASAIEVLEHVPEPDRALAEMARVARTHLLVSVPREPLWRALNMARGAYLRDLGDTPGHLSHWSRRAFVALLARHGDVVAVRSPLPWTMALVRL